MTTFVRFHSEAGTSATGSTVATSLAATVSAGNTLIAVTSNAGSTAEGGASGPASLSVPGGESASWVLLVNEGLTFGSGDSRGNVAIWALVTTVPWTSGYSVVGTWSGAPGATTKTIAISEMSGVSLTELGEDGSSLNENTSSAITAAVGTVLQAGDVTLQAGFSLSGPLTESNGGTAAGARYALNTVASLGGGSSRLYAAAHVMTSSGSRSATYTPSYGTPRGVTLVALKAINYAPNAPTLTSMADGGTVNRGLTQRASHLFSDPNAADTQSKFDLRYRIVGAPAWTTITQVTPNQFYDFAAGALAAGDYERQVRTYDSVGVVGPYSTSGFFTAADATDGPTITDPVNGETIILPVNAFTWSAPDQDAYQVRKVADDALSPGTPDTSTVYYDSGEVIDTTTRTVQLDFPVNGRTEHLQVRVKFDDLWSDWASIVVDVDYSPPPTPTVELSTDIATGSLLVTITNPAPTGENPAASYNDVYVDDGNGEERRATAVPPNTSWRYWLPVSGRDYSTAIRVVAVAASGATASSV